MGLFTPKNRIRIRESICEVRMTDGSTSREMLYFIEFGIRRRLFAKVEWLPFRDEKGKVIRYRSRNDAEQFVQALMLDVER